MTRHYVGAGLLLAAALALIFGVDDAQPVLVRNAAAVAVVVLLFGAAYCAERGRG